MLRATRTMSSLIVRLAEGGLGDPRPTIPGKAEAREAEQHHRPSGGLRNRRGPRGVADRKIEAETAASVGDQIVPEGQIDGGAGIRAEIDDVVLEEAFSAGQIGEGPVVNLNLRAVVEYVKLERLESNP